MQSFGTTLERVARGIGVGPRQTIDIDYSGLRALDISRLAQIADKLGVSIDWLSDEQTTHQSRTSPLKMHGERKLGAFSPGFFIDLSGTDQEPFG